MPGLPFDASTLYGSFYALYLSLPIVGQRLWNRVTLEGGPVHSSTRWGQRSECLWTSQHSAYNAATTYSSERTRLLSVEASNMLYNIALKRFLKALATYF